MDKEKKLNIEANPEKEWRKIFSFTTFLWVLVTVAFLVFVFLFINTSKTEAKIEAMTELNIQMKEAVRGEYEDKEILIKDLRYLLLSETDKKELVSTLKSVIEYEYYEFADTVYDTSIVFNPLNITLRLKAIYNDFDIHEALEIGDLKSLPEDEYLKNIEKHLNDNFEYQVRDKIDIPTFIDEKIGQCYSYSELIYLLGKERGMNVRVELSEYHSWNSYERNDGEIIEFDMTSKLEVKKNEE